MLVELKRSQRTEKFNYATFPTDCHLKLQSQAPPPAKEQQRGIGLELELQDPNNQNLFIIMTRKDGSNP